jgi:CheY-like chemotaxis protein
MNHALLYIEDDENNISLVQALLKRRPQIELHVAMNGRDGVQAALDEQPGLILLDNRLPDSTGGEILRQLASATATAAIPVVVFSGDSGDIIDELLANGAIESVAKPFDVHQFLAIIDRYPPKPPGIQAGPADTDPAWGQNGP